MPKAERRRWVEVHLSRDRDTPAALLLKASARNKKGTRHRKFVSSEDNNALVPFPTYDYLLEEDQPLLGPHQNSYLDDNDSDQDSAAWDWEQSMADGVDEASSTTSLFGAGQWTSTWPSKTVMEIMDAVNFQLEGPDLATEHTDIDQLHGSLSTDDKPVKITTPNEPRNILFGHEKRAIDTAQNTSGLAPHCAAHVLRNALRHESECRLPMSTELAAMSSPLLSADPYTFTDAMPTLEPSRQAGDISSRLGKNRALQLYMPDNANFDELEISWTAWQKRIGDMQIKLISIGNMRETLIDGGRMLLELRSKVDHDHQNWQPQAIPIESVRAQTATHYVVETTYNEETKLHELPKVTKVSMARDTKVVSQVEKQNNGYKKFEEDFDKVMIPLRYAQVQFRNLQLKLEHAIAVEALLLRQAIVLHADLETQWGDSILGAASSPMSLAPPSEPPACVPRDFLSPLPSSPVSTACDSALSVLSRSSRSSSFDTMILIHSAGERQSMETTITSVDEVFPEGFCVSDLRPITRQMCSVTIEVAARVIKDTTEDIAIVRMAPEEPEDLPRSRLHNFRCVEFKNVRRLHRDIMLSVAEKTDERTSLGKLVRMIMWCYAGEAQE